MAWPTDTGTAFERLGKGLGNDGCRELRVNRSRLLGIHRSLLFASSMQLCMVGSSFLTITLGEAGFTLKPLQVSAGFLVSWGIQLV